MSKRVSVCMQISVYFLHTANPPWQKHLRWTLTLPMNILIIKIPTFRDQMSLADFIQFKFLIYFSFESFSTELSQIFLAGCIQGLQYSREWRTLFVKDSWFGFFSEAWLLLCPLSSLISKTNVHMILAIFFLFLLSIKINLPQTTDWFLFNYMHAFKYIH